MHQLNVPSWIRQRSVFLVFLGFFLFLPSLKAQQGTYEFYQGSLKVNNTGMVILGTWALANISVGAYGWSQQTGQRQYFHQMNLFWNTVNLAIAGAALYGNYTTDYMALSPEELMERHERIQRILLINAGLDVGYMVTGLLLRNLSSRYPKNEARLMGYGNSVILQGGFLFLFDLVLYGIMRGQRNDFLESLAFAPLQKGVGLSVQWTF